MSSPSAPILSNAPRSSDGALEFYWYPPASSGDSAISSYTIACTSPAVVGPFDYPVGTKYALVSGLSNGVLYNFTINATNDNSNIGPEAAFRPFEPGTTAPSAVTTATATKVGSSNMLVSWSGATSNDATIYWYTLQTVSSDPGDPIIKRTANGLTQSSLLLTGLNPSSAYYTNVRAVNCPGYSVALSTNTINFGGLVAGSAFAVGSYVSYGLTPSSNIYLSPGSNDYSLEGWMYYDNTVDTSLGIFSGTSFVGITDEGYGLSYTDTTLEASLTTFNQGTELIYGWASSPILTNQWNHIAIARSNDSLNIWINGTGSSNGAQYDGTDSIRFNSFFVNSFLSPAYLTNVRFLNGLTAYDPQCNTITVPTSFLSNIPGTQVLLQMTDSNILSNYGTYQSTVTFNDQMTWSSNTPYAGCGSINGSNNQALTALPGAKPSTFDFSYEAFYYFENIDPYTPISFIGNSFFASWDPTTPTNSFNITDYITNYNFDLPQPTSNTWYHVALARSSLDTTVWLNGTRTTTGVVTLSNDQSFGDFDSPITVFGTPNDIYQYGTNGRYVIGNTAYDPQSATITVPTAPLTAIPGTQLLLLFSTPATLTVDTSGVQSNIPNGFTYSSNSPF